MNEVRPLHFANAFSPRLVTVLGIVTDLSLDVPKLCIGAAFCLAGIAAAYVNYSRKDIH